MQEKQQNFLFEIEWLISAKPASPARSQAMEAALAYRVKASRTAALLLSILTVIKPNSPDSNVPLLTSPSPGRGADG